MLILKFLKSILTWITAIVIGAMVSIPLINIIDTHFSEYLGYEKQKGK
jgi:hypothetical protein